jgi:hypothetical protein
LSVSPAIRSTNNVVRVPAERAFLPMVYSVGYHYSDTSRLVRRIEFM